jgi:hypothetical protein
MLGTASMAQSQAPLPPRLEQCRPITVAADAPEIRYRDCFPALSGEFYGAAYISFNNDGMNLDSYLQALNAQQRRSFLKHLKSLFVSNTDPVLVVARITAKPGTKPDHLIGVYELMRLSKSDSNGSHFSVSKSTKDGLEGPIFYAQSSSKIMVEIAYISERKVDSRISGAITGLANLLGGLGFYTSAASLVSGQREEIKKYDDLITSQFNRTGPFYHTVDLSIDPLGNQALYSRIALGSILPDAPYGNLHVAAVPVSSVLLNNPPADPKALKYADGRWDPSATGPITNRRIDGVPLAGHVRQAMGTDYLTLSKEGDDQAFLNACATLAAVVDDPKFGFSGEDKIAATWAFIAGNPMLKRASVRSKYCLASSEQSGRLKELGMGLPPLIPVPDVKYDPLIEAARLSAARSDERAIAAQQAINQALIAETRARLPAPPEGYFLGAQGMHRYAGRTISPVSSFDGVAIERIDGRIGNRYEGQLSLVGVGLIYEGLGRYIVDKPGPVQDYRDYTGDFQANWFSGYGVMRWPDGREFKGQFARDLPSGYGIVSQNDGQRYYVRMVDGVPTDLAVREVAGEKVGGRWISGTFVPD